MSQINSTHDFPKLHDSLIDVHRFQDSMSCDQVCKSHEVAMDNRQSKSSSLRSMTTRMIQNSSGLSSKGSRSADVITVRASRAVVATVGAAHSASPIRTPINGATAMVTGLPRSIPTHV